jgi:hypothetical protein
MSGVAASVAAAAPRRSSNGYCSLPATASPVGMSTRAQALPHIPRHPSKADAWERARLGLHCGRTACSRWKASQAQSAGRPPGGALCSGFARVPDGYAKARGARLNAELAKRDLGSRRRNAERRADASAAYVGGLKRLHPTRILEPPGRFQGARRHCQQPWDPGSTLLAFGPPTCSGRPGPVAAARELADCSKTRRAAADPWTPRDHHCTIPPREAGRLHARRTRKIAAQQLARWPVSRAPADPPGRLLRAGAGGGRNAWAVAGTRSASRRPHAGGRPPT